MNLLPIDNMTDYLNTGICPKNRIIHFERVSDEDDTSDVTAEKFAKQLFYLQSQSNAPITIYMKNEGGEVGAGLVIYNLIKMCPCRVTVVGLNSLSSMGSLILQAADERKLLQDSYLMIHEGEVSYSSNHPKSVKRWIKLDEIQAERCRDIYLERIHEVDSSYSKKRLTNLMEHDTILSAEEAIELGLLDEIIG